MLLPSGTERHWIGPEYWSNPLQDWRIAAGRLECLTSDANRNVAILTRALENETGGFRLRALVGLIEENEQNLEGGWVGFRIGTHGRMGSDYRDTAVFNRGLDAGFSTGGDVFIGTPVYGQSDALSATTRRALLGPGIELELTAQPQPSGDYLLRLSAASADGVQTFGSQERTVDAEQISGGLALVADYERERVPPSNTAREYFPSFWFEGWDIAGERVSKHPERAFGPILWTQYTLSRGVLKLTAQMPPLSERENQNVRLEVDDGAGWRQVAETRIDPLARTATFRVEDWDDSEDRPYRVVYTLREATGDNGEHTWEGTVRKDPIDKDVVTVAGFTGNNDLGFPHTDVVEAVKSHEPDLLAFTGDNIYESVGGYGYIRKPMGLSVVDYLRKWYLFGWEYRDLLKEIPMVALVDDHDVYQGNIWGQGGKQTIQEGTNKQMQDSGGFIEPPDWVNAVQRTQTSHLPDPFDDTPAEQGINVYYTDLRWGGVSFAVIEDRKWKTAPKPILPPAMRIENGWAENDRYKDPYFFLAPQAKILGDRQLTFLREWAADWTGGTWMKSVISQTIFSTVATLPQGSISDVVVPTLRVGEPGFYPPSDTPTQDMDSNGWPTHARDRAVREMRRGYAFHIAGDQHLASTIQYGVNGFGDAGYAICVPSVANFWPRRWYPRQGGRNRAAGAPKYTGEFRDGFGNRMTVLAVANPVKTGNTPEALYDRAAGYGIVKFQKSTRQIEIANWPRFPEGETAQPYGGWPITISQFDNYGRDAAAWLPLLHVNGLENPVVQVIENATGDIVYTVRALGSTFSPKVFRRTGFYTLKVGDPDGEMQTLESVQAYPVKDAVTLEVNF